MTLDYRQIPSAGGIAEFRLAGGLTLGPHLKKFSEKVLAAVSESGLRAVVLDLSGLTSVDSAGLGELVIFYTTGAACGCRVLLAGVPPRVGELLASTRLDGLLPQFDDAAAARQSMGK